MSSRGPFGFDDPRWPKVEIHAASLIDIDGDLAEHLGHYAATFERARLRFKAAANKVVEGLAPSGPLIVMAFDRANVDVFENWVASCEAHDIDPRSNTVVFAVDTAAASAARIQRFAVVHDDAIESEIHGADSARFGDVRFRHLVGLQTMAAEAVLGLGRDVLLHDVDVVWRHDPRPLLDEIAGDVVAMYDGPNERFQPTFVNTGFVLLRHNERTSAFHREVVANVAMMLAVGSQQLVFDQVLAAYAARGLELTVLPEEQFACGHLYCGDRPVPEDPVVVHMSWTETKHDKLERFKAHDLWFRKDTVSSGSVALAAPREEPLRTTKRHGRPRTRDDDIYVAIAAYREPEAALTIQSCIDNAAHAERLRFGICLQYDLDGPPETQPDCLDHLDALIDVDIVPWTDSKGGCWARHRAQRFYDGEAYTLQIDSHSRMEPNWDDDLIGMVESFPGPKPLITGFPPLYAFEDGVEDFLDHDRSVVPVTICAEMGHDGAVWHPTEIIETETAMPRMTRALSGAFVFTRGEWNIEVRQDPEHLYTGEEFALTIRSYTWGFDLFNPTHVVVWHRTHPEPNAKFIYDAEGGEVTGRHDRAMRRLRTLMRGDPEHVLGQYSIGPYRTVDEFSAWSGIDCANRTLSDDARKGLAPPLVTADRRRVPSASTTGEPR